MHFFAGGENVTLSLAGACMCHCAVLTLSASGGRPAGQVSRRPGKYSAVRAAGAFGRVAELSWRGGEL